MMMRRPKFFRAPMVLFGVAWLGGMSLVTMGLWNVSVGTMLSLPAITIWQAVALFLLSRVLFGRFGGGGWMHRARVMRGMAGLTPEERERFRKAMEERGPGRCGRA